MIRRLGNKLVICYVKSKYYRLELEKSLADGRSEYAKECQLKIRAWDWATARLSKMIDRELIRGQENIDCEELGLKIYK